MNRELSSRPRIGRMRRLSWALASLALAAVTLAASPARAATLEIQITGLDFLYDGNNIFDAGVQNTIGSGDPADGDALVSMNFLVDSVLVGVLTADIWADLYLADIGPVAAVGPTFVISGGNGDTFGVDLLTQNDVPGWGLALDVDTVQFLYTGLEIAISVSGLATGIAAQDLPFGLVLDPGSPVTFVLSSANLEVSTDIEDEFVTEILASGTGNAKGTLIPEPGSIVLMGFGCAAAAWVGVRSRRRVKK